MSSFYSTGTVSIDNNGTAVTGSGTAWVTAGVRSGDYLFVVEATGPVPYLITSVESATALTLEAKTPYEGTGGSGKSYVIARRWDEEKAADTYRLVNEYVAALDDGTFVASAINDATAKTTPVDADLAALADSAASYALKKLTFANLWAWIASKLKGLAIGSASEPSIAFTSDANTGIYSPGADQVAITTGGTARLTVSTTAATSTLPLVSPLGAAGTPSHTFAGDLNTGMWSPTADTVAFSTNGSERLRIDASGYVGIGTSAAASRLHLSGSDSTAYTSSSAAVSDPGGLSEVTTVRIINTATVDNAASFIVGGSGATNTVPQLAYIGFTSHSFGGWSGNIVFGRRTDSTAYAETARIDSAGNLLVGTSTPGASKLVVNDNSIQVLTAQTPASASATGAAGEIAWDANYIYVCTATNTWKRAAIATW